MSCIFRKFLRIDCRVAALLSIVAGGTLQIDASWIDRAMAGEKADIGYSLTASGVQVRSTEFADLDGWMSDNPAKAFAAFRRSCRHRLSGNAEPRPAQPPGNELDAVCRAALAMADAPPHEHVRSFFENAFEAHEIVADEAKVTAYFEPVISGALERNDHYRYPLYGVPADLPDETSYYTRADIADGALEGRGLELVWLADPVDVYFVHIQGSTRIRLDDGNLIRIGFAAKNGHPYASVGKAMFGDGVLAADKATAEDMKDWMRKNPDLARDYMNRNPSYVFFRRIDNLTPELGPIGGEGVPLTTGRSLAVDWRLFSYGLPFWIEADLPSEVDGSRAAFRRLMIAQDTGAAITGPARGDIFWGTGPKAGVIAGRIHHPARFVVLLPRPLAK